MATLTQGATPKGGLANQSGHGRRVPAPPAVGCHSTKAADAPQAGPESQALQWIKWGG